MAARHASEARQVVTCRIVPELIKMLDKFAESERRTRSEMIELAVAEMLERHERSKRRAK